MNEQEQKAVEAAEAGGIGLDAREQQLLSALLGAPSVAAAAESAGIDRATAYRWLQRPAFREELARQRDEVLAESLAAVKTHAGRAVAELAKLLDSADERLRRQVCMDIVDRAIKIREQEGIERRLAALEKQLKRENRRQA
jgi:arginine/lysine/ornithine decarboxylase